MISNLHTPWYDRPWAALIFFTRLPLWRIYQPSKESYQSVVEWWPMVGWLTGGLTAAVLYFGSFVMPFLTTVVAAIAMRLLLTGALHEDGLADFFDGFGGGGSDRQRILDIMKDSHIGTYGVLALTVYELMLCSTWYALGPELAALTVLAADPFAKMVTSQLVMMMPYARREEEAKSKMVYRQISTKAAIGLAIQGLPLMVGYLFFTRMAWEWVLFVPALVMYFLYLMIWRKLRGYTGDCCGAVCLMVELSIYVVVSAIAV